MTLFVTSLPASAGPAVSVKGGWPPTGWQFLDGREAGQASVAIPFRRHLSMDFGVGYAKYEQNAWIVPACHTCDFETGRSAAFIPLSAGLRWDMSSEAERAAPYMILAPTVSLFRLSQTYHRWDDNFGVYNEEREKLGAEMDTAVNSVALVAGFRIR